MQDNGNGTKTILCDDGTSVVVNDGAAGAAGSGCTVTDNGDGTKTIACDDGTSVVVRDGRDATVFDPTINYVAVHDPAAPDYEDNCVNCHIGVDRPASLDPTSFPGFHSVKLASPVIPGSTLNEKCLVCHPTVDLLEGSAAQARRNVDVTICSACHASGANQFYQAQ